MWNATRSPARHGPQSTNSQNEKLFSDIAIGAFHEKKISQKAPPPPRPCDTSCFVGCLTGRWTVPSSSLRPPPPVPWRNAELIGPTSEELSVGENERGSE